MFNGGGGGVLILGAKLDCNHTCKRLLLDKLII